MKDISYMFSFPEREREREREGQMQDEEGGREEWGHDSLMRIKNLNPSTWVSRELFREFSVTRASRYELTKII